MWVKMEWPWLLPILIAVLGAAVFFLRRKYPLRTRKGRISEILHSLTALLCALALCGTSVQGASSERAAFLLLDASGSTAGNRALIEQLAREALAAAEPGQYTGVIAFGADAMVETPLAQNSLFSHVTADVNPEGSHLTGALNLAGALLPSNAAASVAVITDGVIDSAGGDALAARGIPVNVLTVDADRGADAQVSEVTVPSLAYEGQSFPVTVRVDSVSEGQATLVLWANRAPAATREITLRKGENTFTFTDIAAKAGVIAYEAQIILPGDSVSGNNRLGAYMSVTGAPLILVAEGKTGEGGELMKLLSAAGMRAESCAPAALPDTAAGLRPYHAIALVNVDADTLTAAQIEALRTAVRSLGRGLAVFGGDQSYALGGYRGSELESLLPVTMDVKSTLDMPSLALILAIDKSGSMTEGKYGTTRLAVAREAAARAAEVLLPTDQIGVIAFDDAAQWVVPLQIAENLPAIQAQIATIRPGGGTAFYSPLVAAYGALVEASAARKHVIFLSDGEPGDSGFEDVARQMAEEGITLTTVAVGSGANVSLMRTLSQIGGGRVWAADEFDNLPKIFTKETMLVSGSYVQNRLFTPVITEDSALTAYAGFPKLSGYLAVTERPEATVSLMSDREDPLLSWWQYGAGRVLCWTSDIRGGWSEHFLAWDQAAAFFSGMLSHVLPSQQQAGEMAVENGVLRYTAPAADENGGAVATVIAPDGTETALSLSPVSPDTYEAALQTDAQGAYAVTISYQRDGQTVATLEGGAVVSYSKEYDLRAREGNALERLTQLTGGRLVADAKELLANPSAPGRTLRDITGPLLGLALALFVLDVAQRRLPWEALIRKQEKEEKPRPPRRKPPKAPKGPEKKQGETADALLQTLQKRKKIL